MLLQQPLALAPFRISWKLSTRPLLLVVCQVPCYMCLPLHNGNTSPAAMALSYQYTRSLYYGKRQHHCHWSRLAHYPYVYQVQLCSHLLTLHLHFRRLKNQVCVHSLVRDCKGLQQFESKSCFSGFGGRKLRSEAVDQRKITDPSSFPDSGQEVDFRKDNGKE